jgi:hypothetical protein
MSDLKEPSKLQKFFDNPWILIFLGLVVPTLSYTIWGWIEIYLVQPGILP